MSEVDNVVEKHKQAVTFIQERYPDWDGTADGAGISLTGCANLLREYADRKIVAAVETAEIAQELRAEGWLARAEAEQMAKAQVAAFRERAAGVLRSILIEHHLSDTAQASIIGDFRDDVRLPVDDSSLREHDADALSKVKAQAVEAALDRLWELMRDGMETQQAMDKVREEVGKWRAITSQRGLSTR